MIFDKKRKIRNIMQGFQTIGNATLIAYDKKPILTTDPWLNNHEAYFGSWSLDYSIPKDLEKDIFNSEYIWISHGHPDHLNPHSVQKFKSNKILIPDHVGNRIYKWLKQVGYNVQILKDRKWMQLTDSIRVMSIADFNQDAILLLEINNKLVINTNDAGVRSCRAFIRKIAKNYTDVYVLALSGYGDADMINIFTENWERVTPTAALKKPVGAKLSDHAKTLGANKVIPFSSFHKYTREDSLWAEQYTTPIEAYKVGFDSKNLEFIDPFSFVNCNNNEIINLKLKKSETKIYKPEDFGDSWSEELEKKDLDLIKNYFLRLELLLDRIGFINFKVGNRENYFYINRNIKKGITFEVPRKSLMKAIKWEIFDDLLIGNFMKTTFHGKNFNSLYDVEFNPIVAKYADNGLVYTKSDFKKYMDEYKLRSEGEWLKEYFEKKTSQLFRKYVHYDSKMYNFGLKTYSQFKKIF